MTPKELILWMNGAVGILGGKAPTKEQWDIITKNLNETISDVVGGNLLGNGIYGTGIRDNVRTQPLAPAVSPYTLAEKADMRRAFFGEGTICKA